MSQSKLFLHIAACQVFHHSEESTTALTSNQRHPVITFPQALITALALGSCTHKGSRRSNTACFKGALSKANGEQFE